MPTSTGAPGSPRKAGSTGSTLRGFAFGLALSCATGGGGGGQLLGIGRFRRRGDDLGAAFAIGQPDIIDRCSIACRPGLEANIQPVKIFLYSFAASTSSTSMNVVVCGASVGGARVADALGDLQRAELHRLVRRHFERNDPPGDLVEAGEDGGRMFDLVGRGGAAYHKEDECRCSNHKRCSQSTHHRGFRHSSGFRHSY